MDGMRMLVQVCVAGWSMGAIHACMTAAQCRVPVACVGMLPPDSAAAAYCEGALATFTDLEALSRTDGTDSAGEPLVAIVADKLRRNVVFPHAPARFAQAERDGSDPILPDGSVDSARADGAPRALSDKWLPPLLPASGALCVVLLCIHVYTSSSWRP